MDFKDALTEVFEGAEQLQKFSETNNTPEFKQFCLTLSFNIWNRVKGLPEFTDDRTPVRREYIYRPAYHGGSSG
jgi:hypothetical protein